MKFTIIVQADHLNSGHSSAYEFTTAVLQQKHEILCVFFFLDGAYAAAKNIDLATDEKNYSQFWQDLVKIYPKLQLIVCSNSGLRRGINEQTITSGFQLGSIGQLVDACDAADRVITFKKS